MSSPVSTRGDAVAAAAEAEEALRRESEQLLRSSESERLVALTAEVCLGPFILGPPEPAKKMECPKTCAKQIAQKVFIWGANWRSICLAGRVLGVLIIKTLQHGASRAKQPIEEAS
eukprot:6472807-Amphidinium_carterae.1